MISNVAVGMQSTYQIHIQDDSIPDVTNITVLKDANSAAIEEEGWGWKKIVQFVAAIFFYLLFPISYPLKLLLEYVAPFSYLFDSILRIALFPSDLQKSYCLSWVPALVGYKLVDRARIDESQQRLELLGAEFVLVPTDDGKSIYMMRITQKAFREKIEAQGGAFITTDLEDGTTLTKISVEDPLIRGALENMGWPLLEDGTFQFSHYKSLQTLEERKAVLRFHPYGYPAIYEKKYLVNHLALGLDVISFDPRTFNTENVISSEQSIYLDAKAAYEHVRDTWGYNPESITLASTCSGSTSVSFLRAYFPHDNFNMVIEHGFLRFDALVEKHAPFVPWIMMDIKNFLQTYDRDTLEASKQLQIQDFCDNLDNQKKLHQAALERENTGGISIIISTDTDSIVESNAGHELARSAANISSSCFHLIHQGRQGQEGHRENPLLTNADLFKTYSYLMTNRTRIVDCQSAV